MNTLASQNGDGRTWATAFKELQEALAAARAEDSGIKEIWIAKGTYTPAGAGGPRTATFELINDVVIRGGFSGSETQLGQRNPGANRVVLSGDLNRNSDGQMGHNLKGWEDNVFHVVTGNKLGGGTVLEHLAIEHGVANESKSGGGLSLTDASPQVLNCEFVRNWSEGAGAAIVSHRGSPRFETCTFLDNFAVTRAAVFITGNSNQKSPAVLFKSCQFRRNRSQPAAGAMWILNGPPVVAVNCQFFENGQSFWEGGKKDREYGGGVIHITGNTFKAINSVFANNSASGHGSAINAFHGSVQLTNCTIYGGASQRGKRAVIAGRGNIKVQVFNSIIWSDDTNNAFDLIDGAKLEISHSCVRGAKDLPNVSSLGPRIEAAPNWTFRLDAKSKCIDSGDIKYLPKDDFDLDRDGNVDEPLPLDLHGRNRVQGQTVDIGACEYHP